MNNNMEMKTRLGATLHEVPGVVYGILLLLILLAFNLIGPSAGWLAHDVGTAVGIVGGLISSRIIATATRRSDNVRGNDAREDKTALPAGAPEQGQDPA